MRIFDTNVQELKYKVLVEVAYQTWLGNDSFAVFNEIANEIVKKDEPPMSCCIYKDRAIVAERIRLALGGNKDNSNVIQVIDIACDECPKAGHTITDLCRGCIAHRCADACKLGAITFDDEQIAHIDKSKCVECGKCAKVCPYSAITDFKRPCERACKLDAISMAEDGEAQIDNDKCVACGACVYQCPFGATVDTSSIVDIINALMQSENNTKYKVYAIVAPAIASQFTYAKLGQVITAIRELGFYKVGEVALGADMVAYTEAQELIEKGFLTTSCCPAFVKYIKTRFPELEEHISHNLSPMATLGKFIKEHDKDAKVVFIGPCTSKKAEIKQDHVKDWIDYVMTFEELQAIIDSKDIIVEELPETEMDDATYFGRVFARIGGVTDAVTEAIKELGREEFEFNPLVCEGIDKCKPALMRAKKGKLPNNFIEGMICSGGCIGGAGCLTHGEANKKEVDDYGKTAAIQHIEEALEKAEEIM
ncbi:MAG: 4Fe-4S dicluster domain-containing protein [Firmicutes bacterium]|nr:4Fe-4S dicluster domain-containing protein [Bacillota bacterium]